MKKFVFILVGIIMLLGIPATVFLSSRNQELRKKAAPATTLSLSPSLVTKEVGEEFTLEAMINTADNQVVATEIQLVFDPTKLEAISITNGIKFPLILVSGTIESGTASISVGAANTTTPITGSGTAALITFKALAATTTPTSITFAPETFVGALGESATNVLINSIPAKITITSNVAAQTPTPTLSSQTTLTPTPTLALQTTRTATPTPTLVSSSPSASASALQITTPTSNQALLSDQPTIRGKGPPNSTVTVTIYSEPQTVTVVTDANGDWKYVVADPLEAGPHTIVVAALDPITNVTKTATLAFVVSDQASNNATGSAMPISGVVENTIALLFIGLFFVVIGAFTPTFMTIRL